MLSSREFQSFTKMRRILAVYSSNAELKRVPELDQDEQYTKLEVTTHDVVENYLKPITSVPRSNLN